MNFSQMLKPLAHLAVMAAVSAHVGLASSSTPTAVPGWTELTTALQEMPTAILTKLPVELRSDPQVQQEIARLVLQAFTMASMNALGADGDHPVFLPSIGEIINVGQPNADTLYKAAEISPGGVYRLRGYQGTLNQAVIVQVGAAPGDAGNKGSHPGPSRNSLELAELNTDADGRFDVLLSGERPSGHEGDWWQLHPQTQRLMMRQVSSDWANQRDPAITIERLDRPVERIRPAAELLEDRLRRLPQMAGFMANMFTLHVVRLREEGYVNKMKVLDLAATGGLEGQFYYEGVYDLEDDEALIIEAKHPEHCHYRSVILTNEIYQTTDWYNNHSSLNQSQAAADSDGVLRVVVSKQDPGVANWLSTAGYARGVVQGRWTHCDSQPVPVVKRVKVEEIRKYLPADTRMVTTEQRQEIIRDRRAAYQLRRHW